VPSRFVPCPSATAPAGPIAAAAAGGAPAADGTRVLDAHALPVPEGATREMVLTGERIYHGQVGGAACTGCHGQSGTGSPLGPNLTANRWLWSDGTFAGIAATIRVGVAHPRNYRAPMPPMGGAQLSADQVSAVATYVWAISQPPVESSLAATITIPGERVYPESITATADGRLIIGSIARREIFEVRPGASLATPWIGADAETTLGVLGVYADDASDTLWACYSDFPGSTGSPQAPSTLVAFNLESGAARRRYVLPTPQAFCNDIAVAADGTVYVTDTNNMEVDRLRPGENALQRWVGDGAFGAPGGILDGISVVGSAIVVSTLATGRVYSIPVTATGAPGPVTELRLSRPLEQPDGMRVLGAASTVIAESGGAGRLSRLDISGTDAAVTTLREGFPDGPVSVALVGSKAYVLEGQLADLYGPPGAAHAVRAFRATVVDLPAVRQP
jgi:mono/diheme cytochrome c family protein